jgi:hypothetical protein
VPIYRAEYVSKDGCREIVDTFRAADDGEAIELLRLRLESVDCDLWCHGRRVAIVPAEGGTPVLLDSLLAAA